MYYSGGRANFTARYLAYVELAAKLVDLRV
jgi:hypothetical protein